MALLFSLPKQVVLDSNGDPYSGAKAYFFLRDTTTPASTYQDEDLTTTHAHPVVASSGGVFAAIYLDPSVAYDVAVTQSDNTPIIPQTALGNELSSIGSTRVSKAGNYTVVAGDKDAIIECTAALTLTLPSAVTVGNGFRIRVISSTSGTVQIDTVSSQTIKGAGGGNTTISIGEFSSLDLQSDGSSWIAALSGTQVGSFTGTQTGYSASLTPTVQWKRNGSLVTLTFDSASTGTSNAATMTLTGMPSQLYPNNTVVVPCLVTDNGGQVLGIASVATNGTVTFGDTAAAVGGFETSGSKGFGAGSTIIYDQS